MERFSCYSITGQWDTEADWKLYTYFVWSARFVVCLFDSIFVKAKTGDDLSSYNNNLFISWKKQEYMKIFESVFHEMVRALVLSRSVLWIGWEKDSLIIDALALWDWLILVSSGFDVVIRWILSWFALDLVKLYLIWVYFQF